MSRIKAARILGDKVWKQLPEDQKQRFDALSEKTTEQNLRIQANNYINRNTTQPRTPLKGSSGRTGFHRATGVSYTIPKKNYSKGSGGSWQRFEGKGSGGSWESDKSKNKVTYNYDSSATSLKQVRDVIGNTNYSNLTRNQRFQAARMLQSGTSASNLKHWADRQVKNATDSYKTSKGAKNTRDKAWEARDILIKTLGNKGFNSLSESSRKDLIRAYANGTQSADQIRTTAKNMITSRGGGKAPAKPESTAPVYNVDKVVPKDSIASDSIASDTTQIVQPSNTGGATQPVNKGNNGGQPANKDVTSPVEKGGTKKDKLRDTPARTAEQVKKDNTPITYKIRKGETLGEIANKYGVSVKELAANNGIDNPDLIIAGKTLQIGKTNAGKPVPVKPKKKPRRTNRNVEQRVVPNISRNDFINLINSQVPNADAYDNGPLERIEMF